MSTHHNDGKIVISTHCDIVWPAAAVGFTSRKQRKHYVGNLDNLVCVAEVFRSVMPRTKDRRVKFYFTSGEETNMSGAKAVMKREGRALYIPIDVTNASLTSDVNVEWLHNVDRASLKTALKNIPRIKIGFKTGHPDETMIYGKKNPAFSLNLPLEGNMHGKSRISFWKARRFGRAVAEILRVVRKNYDKICCMKAKRA